MFLLASSTALYNIVSDDDVRKTAQGSSTTVIEILYGILDTVDKEIQYVQRARMHVMS